MRRFLVTILVGMFVLSGFSWQSESDGASPQTDADSAEQRSGITAGDDRSDTATSEITLTATEFEFDEARVSLPAGTIRLTLVDDGNLPHDFKIEDTQIQTETIGPGERDTITFSLEEAGTYTFYCTVPGHRPRGMEGTITTTQE